MVFGLPTPGEPNWDVKLDASIEAVKTTADAAEAEIAGRLSESSLTASYVAPGELFSGREVLFIGDSVTNGSNATNAAVAFPAECRVLAGSAYVRSTVAGYPGERSDQILAHLAGVLDAAPSLQHIHVQVGTNDASQSRTLAQFQAAIEGFADEAKQRGLTITFGLVYPRDAAATSADELLRLYNAWLARWAHANGHLVADTFTAIADPTTGFLDAAYDSDGTHPNTAGHLELAKAIAPILTARQPRYTARDFLSSPLGLISNPVFSTDFSGWSTRSGTITGTSVVAPANGDGLSVGNWLQMFQDNTGGGATKSGERGFVLDAAKYTDGDILLLTARVAQSAGGAAKLQVTNDDAAFSVPLEVPVGLLYPGPVLAKVTVPTTPGVLRVSLVASAAAGQSYTAWLGECQVINLTTGGLVNAF